MKDTCWGDPDAVLCELVGTIPKTSSSRARRGHGRAGWDLAHAGFLSHAGRHRRLHLGVGPLEARPSASDANCVPASADTRRRRWTGACPPMRPALKLYITLVCAVAALLFGRDMSVLTLWPHSWSAGVAISLIVLATIGDHLQFEVRRGWYTNASAVAHVSAAFLLPPGLAMAIAGLGALVRAF